MAHGSPIKRLGRPVSFLTDYARAEEPADDALVIPEDLSTLSDEELQALSEQARTAFADLYGDGTGLSNDDLSTLEGLTEGIEALQAEADTRAEAERERAEAAAALAARISPEDTEQSDEADSDEDGEESDEEDEGDNAESDEDEGVNAETEEDEQPQAVAASARREVRVNLSSLRGRRPAASQPQNTGTPTSMRDVVMAAPDVPGFSNGQGMDFLDLGRAVDARLTSFNAAAFERAAQAGRHIRQQFGIATIRKPYSEGLRIDSSDPDHVEEVFNRAADESRLPGGSLVASGGWCAPSETLYDLFENGESRDGLFSLPEVNVPRGGIRFSPGPDFGTLFSEITGFSYTEEQDIAGEYGVDEDGIGNDTEGDKPCYRVDCPDFTEVRLGLDGLCITAGLLQRRGYPEMIARTVRGALVAHDHRLAGRRLAKVVAGSTAVSMPADQVGAAAPILTAIDLQVEHYRDTYRMSRNSTLEAVFPFWVHGAIRGDLSRRLGVDLFDVSDARINAWFRDRGVNAQFVYNWQGVSSGTAASAFVAWPDSVTFLLYAAGTWVGGGSDVITLDTLYDSVLLGQNDYTALFTEEGYLVAKRGHDSRAVTVPVCANGATAGGVLIDCNGAAVADEVPAG